MTARDDAIAAMLDAKRRHEERYRTWTHVDFLVDAIPADVLVRLAVERGQLSWVFLQTGMYLRESDR